MFLSISTVKDFLSIMAKCLLELFSMEGCCGQAIRRGCNHGWKGSRGWWSEKDWTGRRGRQREALERGKLYWLIRNQKFRGSESGGNHDILQLSLHLSYTHIYRDNVFEAVDHKTLASPTPTLIQRSPIIIERCSQVLGLF